jgi:hypothetical protein
LRSQARLLRLWIKPWEDADGDLYDQGYVYVQVDNGQWLIDHVQRQIRDAYAPLKAPNFPSKSATEAATEPNAGRQRAGRADACCNGPRSPGPAPTVRSEVAMNTPHSDPPITPSATTRQAPRFAFGRPVETPAEQFANWLPYSAYLAAEKIFVNRDSMGVMLELMPQSGADERMAEVLVSLYANCPPGTGIQFHLFASPQVRSPCATTPTCGSRTRTQAEQAKAVGPPGPQRQPVQEARPPARRPPAAGRAEVAHGRLPLHDPGLSA